MSKFEEILHKLNTTDRNYIKEKFKDRKEFCECQVKSLNNIIAELIEVKNELETKLSKTEREVEQLRKSFADGIANQFRIIRLRNRRIIDELESIKNEFCKPHLNGNGQKTFSVNRLEKLINARIKNLKQQSKLLEGDE